MFHSCNSGSGAGARWEISGPASAQWGPWLVPAEVSDWESERWEAAKETEEEEKESKGH